MPDSYDQLKAQWERITAKERAVVKAGVRAAFRAGFMAHPEAEAPVFKWSFDSETCAAADREESAWEAYLELKSQEA